MGEFKEVQRMKTPELISKCRELQLSLLSCRQDLKSLKLDNKILKDKLEGAQTNILKFFLWETGSLTLLRNPDNELRCKVLIRKTSKPCKFDVLVGGLCKEHYKMFALQHYNITYYTGELE